MMRYFARPSAWSRWLLVGTLLAGSLFTSRSAIAWGSNGETKHNRIREVEQVERDWRAAELAGDAAALDRMLAEDYVGVTVQGKVHTKAQQLRRTRERVLVFSRMDLSDVKIRISGDVAVVSGRVQILGSSAGKSLDGAYQYTQVLRQEKSGSWTITSFEARHAPGRRAALLSVVRHEGE